MEIGMKLYCKLFAQAYLNRWKKADSTVGKEMEKKNHMDSILLKKKFWDS